MTDEKMLVLKKMHLAPYMQIATVLICKTRHGGGNMFRHQLDTMATLIDYGYVDSVLIKASVVHDVLEDVLDFNHNALLSLDFESHAVYELVREVTRTSTEEKHEFLIRVFQHGSWNAKVLKVADRISNMVSLGFVSNRAFIRRYCDETERYVFPIAEVVDKEMLKELQRLVISRRKHLALEERVEADKVYTDSADFL
ncbi:MAG: hypothetical protein FWE09_01155 [Treponema sp.]|nr:hypothetical protein [Treponema sp.]